MEIQIAIIFVGTNKDEIINTHDGTDVITPSGGEDFIDGGHENDTVILSGKFDDYEITQANIRHNNNDYQFKLTNRTDSSDVKIIRNIENFQFTDKTVEKDNLLNINNNGSNTTGNELNSIGYNLTNNKGETLPLLMGSQVTL